MSAGYASRLRAYPHKGVCGLPESVDTARTLRIKLQALVQLVRNSDRVVAFTGAGISTAAGIPDFRGPQGIWTLEEEAGKRQKKRKRRASGVTATKNHATATTTTEAETTAPSMDFAAAQPTLTHRAVTRLITDCRSPVCFCVTQNVDGLHRRSGLSRDHHAILHGCVFTETCARCGLEHFRDTDVGGMSFQPTGRHCDDCGDADLLDTLLDWEDPLPADDLERAERECAAADVVLCLGTSLRIQPAGELPLKAKAFVIVNLQQTPVDDQAAIVIRAKVDTVMSYLMEELGHDKAWESDDHPAIERHWKMKTEEKAGDDEEAVDDD